MLKLNNIKKSIKVLFLFISIVITSCSVNDKEPFDIIHEAKKILSNITNDTNNEDEPSEIISKDKKKNFEETSETDKTVSSKAEEYVKKDNNKKKSLDIKKDSKNKNTEKQIVVESKLIRNKKKKDVLKESEPKKNFNVISDKFTPSKIKLGVLLPLTGENKEIGNLILNALELALFQTGSNKIHLIIKDTEADPKKTPIILKSLLQENVNLFIGPLYSKSLVALEDFTSDENIKFFALTNNTNLAKNGVWVFGINPQQQTKTILDFIISKGSERIGFLLPDNSYGYLLYNTAQKVLERKGIIPSRVEFFKESIDSQQKAAKKISKGFERYETYLKDLEENISPDSNDENVIKKNVVEKPLDSIFIGASGQTLTILASQLQYSNVDPKKVIYAGTSSWEDESILQEPALNGGYFSATTDFLQKEVSKTYSIAYGTEMPKVAMVAYDILSLLSTTIKEYGDIKTQHLTNENGYLGLRGLFRLRVDGTVERTFQIKTIKKAKFRVFQKAAEFFKK